MPKKDDPKKDDLSEFAEYLAEFDSILGFDAETCPVCGVNISDSVSLDTSPFVVYKSIKNEIEIKTIVEKLELKNIPSKIEKRIDTDIQEEIKYLYDILIPLRCLWEIENN